MRKLFGVLAVLCAAGFVACGSDSGAVGTWVIDVQASTDATRAAMKKETPPGAPAAAFQGMERIVGNMFRGTAGSLTLKGDKTFSSTVTRDGQTVETSGTWSASGDQVTMLTKRKAGQPAEGEDAKPVTLALKGDTLSGKLRADMGFTIVYKRD